MTETATKDFFISYTGRDRSWAEWVAWTLEEAGYSVVIQAWDFRPGGNFILDMQQATQATRTIAVLSALYFDKPFTQSEWAAAFAQDPTSRDRKLIPVRIEECAPPGLLAQIVYVDVFDCEEGEAKERLLSAIAEGRMKPTQRPRFPGKAPERVPFPGSPSSSTAHSSSSPSPDPLPSSPSAIPLSLSTYDESTWVGRDDLISDLTQKLESGCRILTILGITGIGKTALAERVVVGLQDRGLSFQRLNFDDRGQGRDFLSGALALLPKLSEVVTTEDQKDAQNALKHLLQALRTKPFLVQIDSLEMLLEGDEQQGWSTFSDELWLDFFQQLLAGQECQSQLILTTQALPEELEIAASRYPLLWHLQSVSGLSEAEQLQLFHKNGLQPDAVDTDYLKRIGKLYDGHPLVLQVIAKDILGRPFNGNVAQYWQRYQGEFDEAESDRRQKSSSPRSLQLRVKKRVEESLARLPGDALKMVCRSSVYRRSVPESFWLAMLGDETEDQQWTALEVLRSHNLVEEEVRGDGMVLLRQHNLIKRVGGELLRRWEGEWREAHKVAARMWLEEYKPEPDAPNLEKVRGQLEGFHHYCEIEEWGAAKEILLDQPELVQLHLWGYYQEILPPYQQILGKLNAVVDMFCQRCIGGAYRALGHYPKAIEHYHHSLEIARVIGDRLEEGRALNGLGSVYNLLGNYLRAIEYDQQHLAIAREIGDRLEEGSALSSLGHDYYSLSSYPQAIKYHQQHLVIAREFDDRLEEGVALNNLGCSYYWLGDYLQAIEYYKRSLIIARDVGNRLGEGNALGNLGLANDALGNYLQAIEYHQQWLAITREISERNGEGNALGFLGRAYYALGNYSQALQCHQQHLIIAREIGDRWGEGTALGNIGLIYVSLGNSLQSLTYEQQYLSIAREIHDRQGEGNALGFLGRAYDSLGNYPQAIECYRQQLFIASEIGERNGEGASHANWGITLLKLEKYLEAKSHLQIALDIFNTLGVRKGKAEVLLYLGKLHYETGYPELALDYCNQALSIATELGIPLVTECEELLATLQSGEESTCI